MTDQCAQNGNDNEGFDGFLIKDIKETAKKIKTQVCEYCKKKNANLKCGNKKCQQYFHTNCGLQANIQFQFCYSFPVFCKQHEKKMNRETKKKNIDDNCLFCYEKVNDRSSILMPCCKNGYAHQYCMKKYALTSGYYFLKCPLCGDRDICLKKLPEIGIFIPMRDAKWESENYFAEMAIPPKLNCFKCESGDNSHKIQEWLLCNTCGSNGIHYKCLDDPINADYTCNECIEIFEKVQKEKQQEQRLLDQKNKRKQYFFLVSDEELCSSSDSDEEEYIKPVRKKIKSIPAHIDDDGSSCSGFSNETSS